MFKRRPVRTGPAADHMRAMIREHGWMVMKVANDPPFGYTIGIFETFGQPELFICGLAHEDIHELCNRYGEAIRVGETFAAGNELNWLAGCSLHLIEVANKWKPHYLGVAVDEYRTSRFPVLQAIWTAHAPAENSVRQFILA